MTIAGTILLSLNKKESSQTKSGILLPESMVEEENIGTVLYVGARKGEMTPEVSEGDSVVFNHKTHRRTDFSLHGKDVIRIGFEDIYLIK